MSIVSLSDDQLAAIDRAAAPLQVGDRGPFVEAVHDRLAGQLVGPGSLHRALAAAQAEFLRARPLIPNGRPARVPYHMASRAR